MTFEDLKADTELENMESLSYEHESEIEEVDKASVLSPDAEATIDAEIEAAVLSSLTTREEQEDLENEMEDKYEERNSIELIEATVSHTTEGSYLVPQETTPAESSEPAQRTREIDLLDYVPTEKPLVPDTDASLSVTKAADNENDVNQEPKPNKRKRRTRIIRSVFQVSQNSM